VPAPPPAPAPFPLPPPLPLPAPLALGPPPKAMRMEAGGCWGGMTGRQAGEQLRVPPRRLQGQKEGGEGEQQGARSNWCRWWGQHCVAERGKVVP
jgi:hypothetical protein